MKRMFQMVLALLSTAIYADGDGKEAARAVLNGLKTNHFAQHISVPFQEYVNLDYGQSKAQSISYLKPVIPFHLTANYDLIVRTIAPIYERTPTSSPSQGNGRRYVNGWGDLNPTFFITPAQYSSLLIGLGPTVSLPTSTNSQYIGSGKWSVGPELAAYYMTENWEIGFLTNNLWSVAGESQRASVNTFQFEYLVSYLFNDGWYIATNPSITANWKSRANEQWIVPVGIGAGRAIQWGKQIINVSAYSYYNAIRPMNVGPNAQIQLGIEWMFNPTTFS